MYSRHPSVRLFRPDLETLLDTLQKEEPNSVVIHDPDFEYASLQELFEEYSGREIHELDFTARFGATHSEVVMVTLSRRTISVFALETTPKVLAVQMRLKQFFKVHRRQATATFFNPFFYTLMVALLIFLIANINSIGVGDRIASSVLVTVVAGWLFGYDRIGGFSRILSINRYEQDSFLRRNRELVVAIISSIVSAGLAFFVAYLLFKGGIK